MMTFEWDMESAWSLEHMDHGSDKRNIPYITEDCWKHGRYEKLIWDFPLYSVNSIS